jgi:hypothetical protein
MERGKQKQDIKDIVFKRLFGVKTETFEKMQSILQKEFDKLYRQ